MIRGVIIEGMSTVGKTSLFSAIKRLHSQTPNNEKTIIAISEHYSQVLHSHQGVLRSMDKDEHISLLSRHVDYLEQQYDWINSLGHSKPSKGIFFLLERFHVNHRAAFKASPEIELLEKRLSIMNAHCVLLTLTPDAVESRYIDSRGEAWKSYVMGDSSTPQVCETFLDNQENLRMATKQSLIPTIEINTDKADWDAYAKQVLTDLG
ncbi:hypothetical protein [Paenibacillus sp. LK1]|uniref:hypothetical protein n=1 Tax=Paenibacillus sp. LK1 TaxID=2053014 RepID=UPI000C18206B|nr:hypothetical protein [Paenibacillus sp. LK1]PIH58599.1 hypothetical protein CS562_15825 [Paenibacillus sp. LK1]